MNVLSSGQFSAAACLAVEPVIAFGSYPGWAQSRITASSLSTTKTSNVKVALHTGICCCQRLNAPFQYLYFQKSKYAFFLWFSMTNTPKKITKIITAYNTVLQFLCMCWVLIFKGRINTTLVLYLFCILVLAIGITTVYIL